MATHCHSLSLGGELTWCWWVNRIVVFLNIIIFFMRLVFLSCILFRKVVLEIGAEICRTRLFPDASLVKASAAESVSYAGGPT